MPSARDLFKLIEYIAAVIVAYVGDDGRLPSICELLRVQRMMQPPTALEILERS